MSSTKLIDIADALNISITTVSKALKGYKDVNTETRERVLKLAKELNYVPNASAVNLRTMYTKTIGLIIPNTVHYFFSMVISGVLAEAEKHNYLVIMLQSNEKYELEKKQLALLLNHRVDGVLISLSNETNEVEHIQQLIKQQKPIVLFDKIAKTINCSKVIIDDKKAAYEAVSHLIKTGCRKVAHFRGPHSPQVSIDRFLGYKKALEDHNLPYNPALVYVCDNNLDFEDGYNQTKRLLREHDDVDAIFTITDMIATGVLKCLAEESVKVPEQIAVFGFSNWFMASAVTPKLSTVNQPGFEIGQQAAALLIKEIIAQKAKTPIRPETIVIPTDLIIRESTR